MASPHIEDDEPGFFRKYLVLLIIGGIALAGGGYIYANHTPGKAAPKRKEMAIIICPPPVIITPEVKKEEPLREEQKEEKEDKMIVQEEVKPEEPKTATTPLDKPSEELLGTDIEGGDGSGLGNTHGNSNRSTRMIGIIDRGGSSIWGWYAGQVQNRVADALRSHPLTKRAGFSNTVKIWSDNTGRITRVKLNGSTGDSKVDAAIENEIFKGLLLTEAPPDGMPMPINLRLTAR